LSPDGKKRKKTAACKKETCQAGEFIQMGMATDFSDFKGGNDNQGKT